MKITGELLKSERNRKNISVQDVALALKLSSKIINSIEAGQVENLPSKTFIRGFVKSYAQYLRLDADQVMRQFQEEMGTTHPLPKNPPPPPMSSTLVKKSKVIEEKKSPSEQTKSLNKQKSNPTFIYLGIAVVLVILIVATNKIVDHYQKDTVLDHTEISKAQPIDTNSNEISTSTPLSQSAPEMTSSVPQPREIEAAPGSNLENDRKASLQTTDDEGFEPSVGKPIEVIIEAKKDFELSYAKGNTKSFSKIKLLSKQVQVIRSPAGLHLKSDDGGAFHLVVNGLDKGMAGSNNKPIKLTF